MDLSRGSAERLIGAIGAGLGALKSAFAHRIKRLESEADFFKQALCLVSDHQLSRDLVIHDLLFISLKLVKPCQSHQHAETLLA